MHHPLLVSVAHASSTAGECSSCITDVVMPNVVDFLQEVK